ncbi:MAG: AAC(3) family N-acetyltransferase [Firmicutes bacterium HGW-Firmicutes-21]|nr:MAG: AAC(3) family N-acetyltransferase [Firmicutes bacterium HGW-Firmicutes-21]
MEIIDIIKTQLNELGVTGGDTVLVHSSLKALGGEVSPSQIVEALISALSGDGTLVMPTLSYKYCNKDNTYFDYHTTPSNVGVIPEHFRTKTEGVIRSLCPTHSCCAVGEKAEFITDGHVLDTTPCGTNSPFKRVWQLGGKILFLGCGLRPNTSMHAIEELFEPDYLFGDTYEYRVRDREGNSFFNFCRSHNFAGVSQRYDRLEELLAPETEIKTGYILKAFCHLIETKAMWEKAGNAYSSNPHYFVEPY